MTINLFGLFVGETPYHINYTFLSCTRNTVIDIIAHSVGFAARPKIAKIVDALRQKCLGKLRKILQTNKAMSAQTQNHIYLPKPSINS